MPADAADVTQVDVEVQNPQKPSTQSGLSAKSGEGRKRVGSNASSVACPEEDDPGAAVASRGVRLVIFLCFCQGVQAFMSYDGGATPASLDIIIEESALDGTAWASWEIGLLGAIDKYGMTAASLFWGRLLQLCPAKWLLCTGLALNAGATFIFGLVMSKVPMYSAKVFMGATQALQGVWGTVWTVNMAPPDKKGMWLGLGAVSAGIGNGIGTAVAGFGTAAGAPYSFAFILQGCILTAFLVGILFTPTRMLATTLPNANPGAQEEEALGARKQLAILCGNKVYLWTSCAISLIMFEMNGVQFLWVTIFTQEYTWNLNKNFVTTMFLLVTGIGGGVGIAMGPAYIDRHGGFNNPPGIVRSLQSLRSFTMAAVVAGAVGAVCLYGKMWQDTRGPAYGDFWLWIIWIVVFVLWAAHNASIAALCGINCEVVAVNMRSFGSGLEMTLRNLMGFAAGALFPGIVMSIIGAARGWEAGDLETEGTKLYFGLGFVFVCNMLAIPIYGKAIGGANADLRVQQDAALVALREALQTQDSKVLSQAVRAAKRVELQASVEGAAVVGMANEMIGKRRKAQAVDEEEETTALLVDLAQSVDLAADPQAPSGDRRSGETTSSQLAVAPALTVDLAQKLKLRMRELEAEVAVLKGENSRFKQRVSELERMSGPTAEVDKRVQELELEIERLREENERLKKASLLQKEFSSTSCTI